VARAFGANEYILSGENDDSILKSITDVSRRWGGKFSVRHEENWKKVVKGFKGKIAHLTMYGLPVQKVATEIRKEKSLLVVVGGEKVPPGMYELADWNVSVTNQPHSEVAATAILLDRIFNGKELAKRFAGAKIKVIPQERGKKTVENK